MEKYIENIKMRLGKMIDACKTLRTLSGAFAFFDGDIVLLLEELQAKWDGEHRQIINDEKIKYIDEKNMQIITESHIKISISSLNEENLKKLNNYFQIMVPMPTSLDVF